MSDGRRKIHTSLDGACFMLRDTKRDSAAAHVKLLLDHYTNVTLRKAEILFILLYILTLEAGFVTQQEYAKCRENLESLSPISIFNAQNLLEISRIKPSYKILSEGQFFDMDLYNLLVITNKQQESILNNLLTATVVDDNLVVSLSSRSVPSLPGFSICLPIDRYIRTEHYKSQTLLSRLQNIDELDRKLRDEILVPRTNQLFNLLNYNISASLQGLPYNVYDDICQYLSSNDISKLAHVSKTLYHSCTSSKYLVKNEKLNVHNSGYQWSGIEDESSRFSLPEF